MAKKLGSTVIAEGMKTEIQAKFVLNNGGDFIRGYYYAKPMEQRLFKRMLDRDQECEEVSK